MRLVMTVFTRILPVIFAGFCILAPARATEARWIDSVSATVGKDDNSSNTDLYRLGLQNRWNHTWFNDGAWYLGGYWDLEAAYWDSDHDTNGSLYEVSLTPVLRLQRDTGLSQTVRPFAELGVGGHLLTKQWIADRDLSSNFQFGLHMGAGLGFGDKGRYELMYRYQHLSNANTRTPNQAINFHLVSFRYAFK
jgi:lipid A 3-O-deacylase